jgi:hypothetical protein
MSFNINNQEVKEIYVGNKQVLEAYVGSSLVYQVSGPAPGYDSYILRVRWEDSSKNDNLTFQGMWVNGSTATVSSATFKAYGGSWHSVSSTDIEHATTGSESYNCYCNAIEFTLSVSSMPSSVEWKTGTYYAPSGNIVGELVGISGGSETIIAYTAGSQSANTRYTVIV